MAYDPYGQSQDSYPYGQGGQYPSPQYPPSGYDGYGTQQPQMPPQQMGMGVPYGMPMMGGYPARNGVATAALVLGIVAQALFFLMLATAMANANDMVVGIIGLAVPVVGIVGAIVGIVGTSRAKSLMGAGRGKSVAGMILGALAAIAFVAVFALGMTAPDYDDYDDYDDTSYGTTTPSSPDDDESAGSDGSAMGTSGSAASSSSAPSVQPDGLDATQLESMLSGVVWECHADNGEIGAKFTFDSSDKSYAYWRGDADPVAQTGDRMVGHYVFHVDEDAYAYLDEIGAQGDVARQEAERLTGVRGEPVHYMVLLCSPETEIIGGTETPMSGDGHITWECVWMPESRHIQLTNVNSGNSYDAYDSTVPVDQRETAMTRLNDMVMQGLDEDDGIG